MKNPEFIKLLAEKLKNSPEWMGVNGVFVSQFSGYDGVKLFAEYVKYLKRSNGNKIPATLTHLAKDYVDYLEGKSEDEKQLYANYYKYTLPRLYEMIRNAKMTKESILAFANILNELEIGQNPATTIADYQQAVSDSFKFRASQHPEAGKSTAESYKQLIFSQKEKEEIAEKCRAKGLIVSDKELDNLCVSSRGEIYSTSGEIVENQTLKFAVSESLQHKIVGEKAHLEDEIQPTPAQTETYSSSSGGFTGSTVSLQPRMASIPTEEISGGSTGESAQVPAQTQTQTSAKTSIQNPAKFSKIDLSKVSLAHGVNAIPAPRRNSWQKRRGTRKRKRMGKSNGENGQPNQENEQNQQAQQDRQRQQQRRASGNSSGEGNQEQEQGKKGGVGRAIKWIAGGSIGLYSGGKAFGSTFLMPIVHPHILDNHNIISTIFKILFQ
ncbi:MAG: hypothetical protein WC285_02845 [Candidatus Gracilibacteria bacterium]|jgi:hypothetical protein